MPRIELFARQSFPGWDVWGNEVECDINLSKGKSLSEAAQNLFNFLHVLDSFNPTTISVSPIPNEGIGLAINDRLKRASIQE